MWTGSNHDLGRFPSRWCGGDERKIRLALLVLATLPGTTVLYYGDEIGMTDVDVPPALRRDHATLDLEGGADRDRARTPMPWDGSPGSGFTGPGVTPWLPMADPPVSTVADQRDKPESTLSLCQRLLALRRAELGRGLADFENLAVTDGVLDVPDRSPGGGGELHRSARGHARRGRRGPADHLRRAGTAVTWRPSPLGRRGYSGGLAQAAGHDQL